VLGGPDLPTAKGIRCNLRQITLAYCHYYAVLSLSGSAAESQAIELISNNWTSVKLSELTRTELQTKNNKWPKSFDEGRIEFPLPFPVGRSGLLLMCLGSPVFLNSNRTSIRSCTAQLRYRLTMTHHATRSSVAIGHILWNVVHWKWSINTSRRK